MEKLKTKINFLVLSLLVAMMSCSDNKSADTPGEEKPPTSGAFFTLEKTEVKDIHRLGDTFTVGVETNVNDITLQSTEGWCQAEFVDGKIELNVDLNSGFAERTTRVKVESKSVTGPKFLNVYQKGISGDLTGIKDDIKQKVSRGIASSFQPGSGIEHTFDGKYGDPIYHSNWSNASADYWPITLQYFFDDVDAIDYLVYYPRTSGGNGHFKDVEIWVATKENPTMRKVSDSDFEDGELVYDDNFGGTSIPKKIEFHERILQPSEIKFIVKSGAGDGQGFAACAQMDFLKINPDNFDYTTIFNDETCSALKSGIKIEDINSVKDDFYRNLALEIFNKTYEDEFRVQTYSSYQHPDIQARINKTNSYGLRDNPTGIYASVGQDLIVFCEDPKGASVGLFIQDVNNTINGQTFPLNKGLNRITPTKHGGLIYIMYYTDLGIEKDLKINIVTGDVNGYYDISKHKKDEWKDRLNKAKFRHFDVIGKKVVLTFDTDQYKMHTKNGYNLAEAYDEMVGLEQELMGLYKYKDYTYKNKMYFVVTYDPSAYMYATSYHTAYNVGTLASIINEDQFRDTNIWGPAHEIGHVHQTRPGLLWKGMTEVTNNIHSLYVQTNMSKTSRLMEEDRYSAAIKNIVNVDIAHNYKDNDVFEKLVPFWQLKLYMHDVLGNTDFYPDIYQRVRVNDNPKSQGLCQLEFVKNVCDVAQLNFIEFFTQWGFLKACDFEIDDYGKAQFVITQKEIDDTIEYIESKGYAKPKHNNIYTITDDNWRTFR